MAQNDNRNRQPHNQQAALVDPATIKAWIKNQAIELQNQKGEQQIRLKEIEVNGKLAEKSIELQKEILTNQGPDFRMTITRLAYISGFFIVLILLFIGFCLYTGNKEFAYKFCQGIGYIITTGLGYFFGRRSKGPSQTPSPPPEPMQTF